MHLHSIILTEENWQNKPNHEDQNILEDTENKGCYSIAPKDKCPILIHDSLVFFYCQNGCSNIMLLCHSIDQ